MTNPLKETPLRQLPFNSDAKAVFVGIGSELRGDDAVGVIIINRLAEMAKSAGCSRFLFINGGSAPENILGEIRVFRPEIIVFIDAAILGGAPGTIRVIDTSREKITGISFCTHTLPLAIVANYIRQAVPCEIFVIGVEPGNTDFCPDIVLTPPVAQAAEDLIEAIASYAGLGINI